MALIDNGLWSVAILTFLLTIAIPLFKHLLLSAVLCRSHHPSPRLTRWLRYYHQLDTWGMLEIYMLGILIALVKLGDLAEVVTGLGLYSFAGLLITSLGAHISLDKNEVWERLES